MAYNYSEYFLVDNQKAVLWLVGLAREASIGSQRFSTPAEARNYRYQISSLLACLAYNHPDMAWVKNRLRTWISHEQGWVTVNVGVPPAGARLRGTKPLAIEVGPMREETIDIPSFTKANANSIMLRDFGSAMLPDSTIKEVIIRHIEAPEEDMAAWRQAIQRLLAARFDLTSEEPLIFRRRETSANDALPLMEGK